MVSMIHMDAPTTDIMVLARTGSIGGTFNLCGRGEGESNGERSTEGEVELTQTGNCEEWDS